MKVITFSRYFPSYHPKKGEETFFREKIWAGLADNDPYFKIPDEIINWDWHEYYNAVPKHHTIRAGNRWKEGEWFSPRVWNGKPYKSKQIEFALPIQIKKILKFDLYFEPYHKATFLINGKSISNIKSLSQNDGLSEIDMLDWFKVNLKSKSFHFDGQIISWNEKINY